MGNTDRFLQRHHDQAKHREQERDRIVRRRSKARGEDPPKTMADTGAAPIPHRGKGRPRGR